MRTAPAYCRPCDADVRAHRSRGVWWLALAAVAIGMVGLVIAASLIGPFVMFALPFMALFGFALGPLASLVEQPATCPRCHRELVWRHRGEVPAEHRRAAPALAPAGQPRRAQHTVA